MNDYGCRTQWVIKGTRPLNNKERARCPTRVHVWAAIGHNFITWTVLPNGSVTIRARAPDHTSVFEVYYTFTTTTWKLDDMV